MVANTIHWINLSPHIAQSVSLTLIRWKVIYPLNSAILLLNNRSQINQCPVDKYICDMQMRYPLDRDWSSGKQHPPFENLGPESYIIFKVIIRNRFLTIKWFKHAIRGHIRTPGGGGGSAYKRGGDACRKFWIKPLKETDLGMAQAFFDL